MSNINNFFTDKSSIRTIDLYRILYLVLAVTFFVITEVGRFVYRPYIYANDIDDWGLADSIGNLGGIVVQIFFMLAIFNPPKIKGFRVILFLVLGYILYEILQPVLPRGVFDWKDIFGTIIGGCIASLFYLVIPMLFRNKEIHKF